MLPVPHCGFGGSTSVAQSYSTVMPLELRCSTDVHGPAGDSGGGGGGGDGFSRRVPAINAFRLKLTVDNRPSCSMVFTHNCVSSTSYRSPHRNNCTWKF